MKNLYAFSDNIEEKLGNFQDEEQAVKIAEEIDFDPYEDTLATMTAKLFNYAFGIPIELWSKKLVDFTEEDDALMDAIEEEFITFTRA